VKGVSLEADPSPQQLSLDDEVLQLEKN
jgi:hypothetical protein